MEPGFFSVAFSVKTRVFVCKLEHRRSHQNTKKHFSTVLVIDNWCVLPRQAVESPARRSSEPDCVRVDMIVGILLWVAVLMHGLDQMDPEIHSNSATL